ncbi:MAG: hypothetical protein QOG03_2327 [Actinomycetota bacterium]|jgi:hypothetical protein|nr:hypothetical protein [Actinomycetota bacterium]
MRLRNFVALMAAVLLAAGLAMLPPAHAKTTGCDPACSVAGSVVGSVIEPPYNLVFHGTITEGAQTYFFKVEGPYNFSAPGALAIGTVKIVGPGAPNGRSKLWANVRFDTTADGVRMSNATSSNVIADGDFTIEGNTWTGEADIHQAGFEGGGGGLT